MFKPRLPHWSKGNSGKCCSSNLSFSIYEMKVLIARLIRYCGFHVMM